MHKYNLTKKELEEYPKLQKMFSNPKFRPKRVRELDVSNQKAKKLPLFKILEVMPNLLEIDLSNNNLSNLQSKAFSRGCPQLEKLNLDNNNIDSLKDILGFSKLENLEVISFIDNPITKDLMFIQILQELILPDQYNSDSYIEVFTASYQMVPNIAERCIKLPEIDQDNIIYDMDVAKMGIHQFLDNSPPVKYPGNLCRKLRWILSVIDKPCPNRRIGEFRHLKKINGRTIKIYDIFRVSASPRMNLPLIFTLLL